ncbi:MAG: GGDEF domain-containing protein [Chloroflexi bacterium]|nr:GGDEF domain-containing protein [Chloroflexota bacterium]
MTTESQGRSEPADFPLEARLRLLGAVPMLAELTPEQLAPLAAVACVERFAAGERILHQDDPGDCVYLVADGRVQVLARIERDGIATEATICWLGPGETLGELSLLDGQPRSASCVAGTDTVCLRLERADFLRALEQHWPLSRALFKVLAHRLRRADGSMAEQARDVLTGLYSRRALPDLYERELARMQRARKARGDDIRSLAVLFVDVDRFKEINDTYGHHTGDQVLRAVARTLSDTTRGVDLVVRLGGDEFVVLLPEAGSDGVWRVATQVRRTLQDDPPGPVPFTVSIGAALVNPSEPQSLDDLLTEADDAMYRDKFYRQQGRDLGPQELATLA